jgi:RimJ/RimL family protein N-acetyltransferase
VKTVLETERLILREMSRDDLDFVARMLADPEVMRFYPKALTQEEAQAWIDRQVDRYARHGHGLWLAIDRDSAAPIGQVGLLTQEVEGTLLPEIGYLLHRPFWHRGFATEAALAIRDYAFTVLGKPKVFSLIRPDNKPSQAVARRLGMSPEREVLFRGLQHVLFSVSHEPSTH